MWLIRYPLNILCASLPAGWLSWFGNSLVMFVLYRQRATLQSTDLLTLNLAISDASISIFGYSRGILEIFNIFKDDGYLITWIWTCQVKAKLEQDFKIVTFGTTSLIAGVFVRKAMTVQSHQKTIRVDLLSLASPQLIKYIKRICGSVTVRYICVLVCVRERDYSSRHVGWGLNRDKITIVEAFLLAVGHLSTTKQ